MSNDSTSTHDTIEYLHKTLAKRTAERDSARAEAASERAQCNEVYGELLQKRDAHQQCYLGWSACIKERDAIRVAVEKAHKAAVVAGRGYDDAGTDINPGDYIARAVDFLSGFVGVDK